MGIGIPESRIEIIPDMSKLDDDQLRAIDDFERNIWTRDHEKIGHAGEYGACEDVDCRLIISADEVFPELAANPFLSLAELEKKNGGNLPKCAVCEKGMKLIFDPEVFWAFLKDYYKHRQIIVNQTEVVSKVVGALMIDGDDMIMGTTVGYPTTMEDIVAGNINYRNSYDVDEVLGKLAQLMGLESAEDAYAAIGMCWNRVAFRGDAIGKGRFKHLVAALLNQLAEYDDLPLVLDTRPDSRLYPLLKAIGYEDVIFDQHGWVMMFLETQAQLREALNMDDTAFKEKHGEKLAHERREQEKYVEIKKQEAQEHLKQHGHLPRRHFKGAALVDDFRKELLEAAGK